MGRYRITGKDTAERLKEDRACSKALKYSILRKDSFMNKKITEEGNECRWYFMGFNRNGSSCME